MKRAALFLTLLLIFALWTLPHRRIVEHVLAHRFGGVQADITLGDVSLCWWPPGYTLRDVRVRASGYTVVIESVDLQLLFGSAVRAHACGGSLTGAFASASRAAPGTITLRFEGLNPALCVEGSPVTVTGSFTGTLALASAAGGRGTGSVTATALEQGSLTLEGTDGSVSGYLPVTSDGAAVAETARPIGSWEFHHAELHARLQRGEVVFEDASADAEGVHWELSQGRLTPGLGGKPRVVADLRAHRVDDSPRAKAILGVLPRAGEDAEGWRRYRITGTLDAPRVIGLK